jgi:hypothetical protein
VQCQGSDAVFGYSPVSFIVEDVLSGSKCTVMHADEVQLPCMCRRSFDRLCINGRGYGQCQHILYGPLRIHPPLSPLSAIGDAIMLENCWWKGEPCFCNENKLGSAYTIYSVMLLLVVCPQPVITFCCILSELCSCCLHESSTI